MDQQLAARRRVYLGAILSNLERLLQTYTEEDDEYPILVEFTDYIGGLHDDCDLTD